MRTDDRKADDAGVAGAHSDRGFVLFVVLVAVLAMSGLAMIIARRMTADAGSLAVEASSIQARTVAQSGLARAIVSFESRHDQLGLTPYAGDMNWSFGPNHLRLHMRAESSKIDVLRGDLGWIRHVIEALVHDKPNQEEVLERITQFRRNGAIPSDLTAILPRRMRVSNEAHILDDHLTILVSQNGVDPIGSSSIVREAILADHPDLRLAMERSLKWGQVAPDLAAALGNQISLPKNLFSLEAQAALPNGIRARRRALVTLAFDTRQIEVLREFDLPPDGE